MQDKNISEENRFYWRYETSTDSLRLCSFFLIQHNKPLQTRQWRNLSDINGPISRFLI